MVFKKKHKTDNLSIGKDLFQSSYCLVRASLAPRFTNKYLKHSFYSPLFVCQCFGQLKTGDCYERATPLPHPRTPSLTPHTLRLGVEYLTAYSKPYRLALRTDK